MTPLSREKSTFQLLWEDRVVAKHFRSGVSLHSHTMHSEENLDLLPRHIGRLPILSRVLPSHIDYRQGFWTPPLSPRQAYRLEEKQIQRRLQLPALVSLTDHDDIRAGTMLRVMDRYQNVPISVEWSVPFGCTFFHIGIHNLAPADAHQIMHRLKRLTARPDTRSLCDMLSFLNAHPDVLLVLNHPLWDEKGVGSDVHAQELGSLLLLIHRFLHALELNGLRSWEENCRVIRLGKELGKPVISGGDRHGCEPNAIINLSAASTFPEFVAEVRQHGQSHVVFMPQYRQPLNWRTMQTVIHALRDYPNSFTGRHAWTERVFYRSPDGSVKSMADLFQRDRVPPMFKVVTAAVRVAQLWGVHGLVRVLMSARDTDRCSLDTLTASCTPLEFEEKLSA